MAPARHVGNQDGMRLICPNCDAEYEVDDSAIPDGGRDVQCSNCGHAWFQMPPAVESDLAEEEALFGRAEPVTAPPPVPQTRAPETREGEPGAAEFIAPQPEPAPLARRALDENLMAVLREEAEREAAARRAEQAPIETQTEMPLAAPSEALRRIARLKGQPAEPEPAPVRAGSRRELLPDIEEINSSLRTAGADGVVTDEALPPRRGGFRSGFLFSLLLAGVGAAVYATAPRLAQQFPQAGSVLDGYVQSVDQGRLWLDAALRRATESIREMTSAQGG